MRNGIRQRDEIVEQTDRSETERLPQLLLVEYPAEVRQIGASAHDWACDREDGAVNTIRGRERGSGEELADERLETCVLSAWEDGFAHGPCEPMFGRDEREPRVSRSDIADEQH
jgi:hypothetical protein